MSAPPTNGALTVEVRRRGPASRTEREHASARSTASTMPAIKMRLHRARSGDRGDIARIHGGDIALSESPLGGSKAVLKVPV